MSNLKGKKLLVLGGTNATKEVVNNAREMGIYTIVTDDQPDGVSKRLADETAMVSTTDMEGLAKLMEEKQVDGVFCGPSEFNIGNLIKLCEKTGYPCYTDMKTWQLCAIKDEFKKNCRKYGVDCTPEYEITEDTTDEELEKIDYPIILKPVDGSSSAGISVCTKACQVRSAYKKAMDASNCKRIIAEKYIDNGGELFNVRYLLKNGEAYPYFLTDTYIADPINKKSLISAFSLALSKRVDYYMKNMDKNVREMLKGMGLKNGTAFFQALPCDGKIYFHEMGFRLSGSLMFRRTVPLVGVNDVKMMIKFALGEEMFDEEEIKNIDFNRVDKIASQLSIPLNAGKITKVAGFEEVKAIPEIVDAFQYYKEGDVIESRVIGTLGQHFARFTIVADSRERIFEIVEEIHKTLLILDENGNDMHQLKFDLNRVK